MAPFFQSGLFGEGASLLVALAIGFGFGFALERAGFGSARKLVAQFYLTDLSVFKVMFTAIVTAMLGLYYLASFGLLDLTSVYVEPTYLLPQTVGGFVLGAGFIIGGYCPGTSVVALASGRRDAAFYLLGMALGVFLFGESSSLVDAFYTSTPKGVYTLPEAFGVAPGIVVAGVVAMALVCFRGAEWIEARGRGDASGGASPGEAAAPAGGE